MGKKILLADDSITIQKVIELTFSDEDFDVVTVGNGRLALEKVTEIRPDIVLCDIIMPEKDGYEVCDTIKKDPSTSHIPVLLLTGAFEPFDQDRANKVGADGYLAKPFEPQALVAKVKDILGRAPARGGARPAAAAPAPAPPAPAPTPPPATAPSPPASSFAAAPARPAPAPAPAAEPEREAEFSFEAEEEEEEPARAAEAETEELTAEPEPEEEPEREAEPEEEPEREAEPEFEVAAASVAEPEDDPARYAPTLPEPPPWERPATVSAVSNETSFAAASPQAAPASAAPNPPAASVAAEVPVPTDMVEKIAQRVVAQVSEKLIREIAWEVIPDLAEALITKEIERLKAELQQT
jgi:CheY-like chemotaxis protein